MTNDSAFLDYNLESTTLALMLNNVHSSIADAIVRWWKQPSLTKLPSFSLIPLVSAVSRMARREEAKADGSNNSGSGVGSSGASSAFSVDDSAIPAFGRQSGGDVRAVSCFLVLFVCFFSFIRSQNQAFRAAYLRGMAEAAAPRAAPAPARPPPVDEIALALLESMGFPRDRCEDALRRV